MLKVLVCLGTHQISKDDKYKVCYGDGLAAQAVTVEGTWAMLEKTIGKTNIYAMLEKTLGKTHFKADQKIPRGQTFVVEHVLPEPKDVPRSNGIIRSTVIVNWATQHVRIRKQDLFAHDGACRFDSTEKCVNEYLVENCGAQGSASSPAQPSVTPSVAPHGTTNSAVCAWAMASLL